MGIWKYSESYKAARRNDDGADDIFRGILAEVEHIAISIIEWAGIPSKSMSRDIEYLCYTDRMCAIDDWQGVPTVLKVAVSRANMYGAPVELLAFYPDGSTANIPVWDGSRGAVLITDTQVYGFGRVDLVGMWADRYTDAQVTIDTQIVNQRTPLIVTGADKNALTKSQRIVVDLVNGVKCIAVEDGVVTSIKALDLNAPWNVPDLVQLQHEYIKRMYSDTGCDASAWGKRERLIVDEQESDDESLALVLQDMLNPRLAAAEQLQQKYGWPVEPRVITPVRIKSETDTDDGQEGAGDDAA